MASCEQVLLGAGLKIQLHANDTAIEGRWEPVYAAIQACHQAVHTMGCPRVYTRYSRSISAPTRTRPSRTRWPPCRHCSSSCLAGGNESAAASQVPLDRLAGCGSRPGQKVRGIRHCRRRPSIVSAWAVGNAIPCPAPELLPTEIHGMTLPIGLGKGASQSWQLQGGRTAGHRGGLIGSAIDP
jgi:hypothetical protein